MQETCVADPVVQRAKTGDSEAITQLYEEHAPRLYRYFLPRLGGRSHQAEDLTEEVFVRVLERIESYEDRGLPFGAWLFRIAHNLLIDHQRRLPHQPHVGLEECEELQSSAAEQSLAQAMVSHELREAMRHLTREQQQVLVLRFIRGLSIAEAAASLSKTEESVKKLQARALQAMRRLLAEPAPAPERAPATAPAVPAGMLNLASESSTQQL